MFRRRKQHVETGQKSNGPKYPLDPRAMVQKSQEYMSTESSSTGGDSTLGSSQSSYTLESNRESESNFRVSGWDGTMPGSFAEEEEYMYQQEYDDDEDDEGNQEYPHLSYEQYEEDFQPYTEIENEANVWEHDDKIAEQEQYVYDPNAEPIWADDDDAEEADEGYVEEVDPHVKYKDAKPTQTTPPQRFLPTNNTPRRNLSISNMLKVPHRLSLGRKANPRPQQGGRPPARPMTMAYQPVSQPIGSTTPETKPSPLGRPVPRRMNNVRLKQAARPMTMARQTALSPAATMQTRATPGGKPRPRPMTMALPAPGKPHGENNLRVQAAVKNVEALQQQAVKNVAQSFESRGNLARAKAKPVQAKFKAAHARRRNDLEATNPRYRG